MNLQEREQLNRFLQQMTRARAGRKAAEAEALIRDAVADTDDSADAA